MYFPKVSENQQAPDLNLLQSDFSSYLKDIRACLTSKSQPISHTGSLGLIKNTLPDKLRTLNRTLLKTIQPTPPLSKPQGDDSDPLDLKA